MRRVCRFLQCAWVFLLASGLTPAATGDGTPAPSICRVAHLTASDPGVFDSFGRAADVSGNDRAIVGALFHNHSGVDTGSAYVFESDGSTWVQTQELLPSDGQGGDWFGWSTAIDGNKALVGALQHVHLGLQNGSVYAFRFNGSSWVAEQELLASDGALGDAFGGLLAMDGDVAVIGAPGDDDNGSNSGSAYIFRFDGTSWVQEQKLMPSDAAANDAFGGAVSVSGDAALISALDSEGSHGAVYVFRFNGKSWDEEQKLVASDGAFADLFGESVSLSGDTALIGATTDDDNGQDSGSAYVFKFNQQSLTWIETQKLVASDGTAGDQFGRFVAIDGNNTLVGAFAANGSMGKAYLFRAKGGLWTEQEILEPAPGPWTAFFGWPVALSEDTAIVGAHGENVQRGAAYVFAGLSGTDCNKTDRGDTCDILFGLSQDANGNSIPDECECVWDLDGGGDVGITDFLALLMAWGTDPGGPPDFDGDGTVGIVDFLSLLANWGPCP